MGVCGWTRFCDRVGGTRQGADLDRGSCRPLQKAEEIEDLENQVAAPNLWDDPENAQRVTSRLSAAQAEVDRVKGLRSRLDDLAVLVELAQDEADAASLAEADAELTSLRTAIDALEVRTLLLVSTTSGTP